LVYEPFSVMFRKMIDDESIRRQIERWLVGGLNDRNVAPLPSKVKPVRLCNWSVPSIR
jgi:hypothetical protein